MFQEPLEEAWREYLQILKAKQWTKEAQGEINGPAPSATYPGTEILRPNKHVL